MQEANQDSLRWCRW